MQASCGLNFQSDLHLTFLVTPLEDMRFLEWKQVYQVLEARRNACRDVAAVIELEGICLQDAARAARCDRKGWTVPRIQDGLLEKRVWRYNLTIFIEPMYCFVRALLAARIDFLVYRGKRVQQKITQLVCRSICFYAGHYTATITPVFRHP